MFRESGEETRRRGLIGRGSIMVGLLEVGDFTIGRQVHLASLVGAVWKYFKRGRIVHCQGQSFLGLAVSWNTSGVYIWLFAGKLLQRCLLEALPEGAWLPWQAVAPRLE